MVTKRILKGVLKDPEHFRDLCQGFSYEKALLHDPCVYCGKPSSTHEHVIPRSQGGIQGLTNVVGACKPCNHERGNQPFLVWMLTR